MSVILDAGPGLNFLAVGQENSLIQLAQRFASTLCAPERVQEEVQRNCGRGRRFSGTRVEGTWAKLKGAGRLHLLSDDVTDERFAAAISRVSGVDFARRVQDSNSLGEIMVIAHASVLAQDGTDAVILMDDGDGRTRAKTEITWLRAESLHARVSLLGTRNVLELAEPSGWLRGGKTWRQVYKEMQKYDDGLGPLS